jgi:hypothetical protein
VLADSNAGRRSVILCVESEDGKFIIHLAREVKWPFLILHPTTVYKWTNLKVIMP